MTRVFAGAGALVGAVLNILSLIVLPWSRYGDISIGLDRFTGWQVHAASVMAMYACVLWALWPATGGRRAAVVAGAVSGTVAGGSAIVLFGRYDNAADFFTGAVPLVMPSPGLGPLVAVLGIAVGMVSMVDFHVAAGRFPRATAGAVLDRPPPAQR